jgi:hypothetical protein
MGGSHVRRRGQVGNFRAVFVLQNPPENKVGLPVVEAERKERSHNLKSFESLEPLRQKMVLVKFLFSLLASGGGGRGSLEQLQMGAGNVSIHIHSF